MLYRCRGGWRWVAMGMVGLIWNSPAGASSRGPQIDGSLSLLWYAKGQTQFPSESPGSDHRFLERVRLNARRLAPGVNLYSSFSIRHGTGGTDLEDAVLGRIHLLYAEARAPVTRTDLRLRVGRHWRSGTGTTGLLDGVTVSVRESVFRCEAFFGTRDWEDRDEFRLPSLGRSRWIGGSAGMRVQPWIEIGGGYDEIRREDVIDRQAVSGSVEVRPGRAFRVLAGIRHDFVRDYTLDQRVRAWWRPDARRELWAEVARRRPDLDPNSFLANFRDLDEAKREEYRLGGRWAIVEKLALEADFVGSDYGQASPGASDAGAGWGLREPDSWSFDTRVRLRWQRQSVGWYGSRGYGGDRDGLLLSLGRQIERRLRIGVDANVLSYEYGRGERVSDDFSTLGAFLEAQLDAWTHVTALVERLSNRADDSDVRFLLRIRRGFRLGG